MLIPFRRLRRLTSRPVLYAVLLIFLLDTSLIILSRPSTPNPPLLPHQTSSSNETFFIASIHRNNALLLSTSWTSDMLHLISHLGPDRVHFSAVESGSQDDTKHHLSLLKRKLDDLGVSNTIVLGETTQQQLDEINSRPPPSANPPPPGWVWHAAESRFELRRIPYLARARNLAMAPLLASNLTFSKVLWFNDVVFSTADVTSLLATNGGSYAAACAMDFTLWPYYYDTFALRDDLGQKTASWYWPWFQSRKARRSAERMEPVAVKSCWNGLVAFDAAPFYDAAKPLRFRGIDDGLAAKHLEGSECCLVHADNYLSREKGVYLNPAVRVGYNAEVYEQINMGRFPTAWVAFVGVWANRYLRIHNSIQLMLEEREVNRRLRQWADEAASSELPRLEHGKMCLINEMQIMWMNGWKHI
ncbi:hypothetical protein C8034_v005314 [Colletotrichum sidae]|uniref:Alpha-1,3-mannosyltransferase CMT1 n=1 Tax=Colletotrichum sidae TaxID=1347389 RepID=A0A4R8T6N2_9PEZI|nr:hypothetical protein C8034_v005314 [Colletotrichum sidae]